MSFCVSPQPASLRTCSGSILPKNRMRTCRVFSRQTSFREQSVKPAHVRYDGTRFTMPIQEIRAEHPADGGVGRPAPNTRQTAGSGDPRRTPGRRRGRETLAEHPAGLGVVENRVVWDDKILAVEPDPADSRARGGIFGTAESWGLDVRCDEFNSAFRIPH